MYKFRITYSDDVTSFYEYTGTDTSISMLIEAETFQKAEDEAELKLEGLLHGTNPDRFQIVSVQKLDVDKDTDKDWKPGDD